MDFLPTILEAIGATAGPEEVLDGESLIPVLTGTDALRRESIYFHYPNYAFHQENRLGSAVRKGDFKLIHYYDDDSVELYNVTSDMGDGGPGWGDAGERWGGVGPP
jgi:arylsulfatase A